VEITHLWLGLKPRTFKFNSRILDVGNGPNHDNVVFALSYQTFGNPFSQFYNNS